MALKNNHLLLLILAISSTFLCGQTYSHISLSPSLAPAPSPSSLLSPSYQTIDATTNDKFVDDGAGDYDFNAPFTTEKLVVQAVRNKRGRAARFLKNNMQTVSDKTQQFIDAVIMNRLNDPTNQGPARSCYLTCKEVYENGVDDMRKGIEDVTKDLYKVNFDLGGYSSNIDTCTDCINQMVGEDPDFMTFENSIKVYIDKCYDRLQGVAA